MEEVKSMENWNMENYWDESLLNTENYVFGEESYKIIFKNILNKLTSENVTTVSEQVKRLDIYTEEELRHFIDLIVEKAITEPNSTAACSKMCKQLSNLSVPMPSKINPSYQVTFRRLLFDKCQKQFETKEEQSVKDAENELEAFEDPSRKKELEEKLEREKTKVRTRAVGNVRFIGELYKLEMFTANIMGYCIKCLLDDEENELQLECLCELLNTIGAHFEGEHSPRIDTIEILNYVFNKLQIIVAKDNSKISRRVRSMIQDVIEPIKRQLTAKNKEVSKASGDIKKEAELQHMNRSKPVDGRRENRAKNENVSNARGEINKGAELQHVNRFKPEDRKPGNRPNKENVFKSSGEIKKEAQLQHMNRGKLEDRRPGDRANNENLSESRGDTKKGPELQHINRGKPEDRWREGRVNNENVSKSRGDIKKEAELQHWNRGKPGDRRPGDRAYNENVSKSRVDTKKWAELQHMNRGKPEDRRPGDRAKNENVSESRGEIKKGAELINRDKPEYRRPGYRANNEIVSKPRGDIKKGAELDHMNRSKPEDRRPGDRAKNENVSESRGDIKKGVELQHMNRGKPEDRRPGYRANNENVSYTRGDIKKGAELQHMNRGKPEVGRRGDRANNRSNVAVGSVLVPPGAALLPPGSVLVPPGAVAVPPGWVLISPGLMAPMMYPAISTNLYNFFNCRSSTSQSFRSGSKPNQKTNVNAETQLLRAFQHARIPKKELEQEQISEKVLQQTTEKVQMTDKGLKEITEQVLITGTELNQTTEQLQITVKELNQTIEKVPITGKELKHTTEQVPITGKELKHTTEQVPITGKELNQTTEQVPITGKELDQIAEQLPITEKELDHTTELVPVTANGLPQIAEQLPITGKEFDQTTEQIPKTGKELDQTTEQALDHFENDIDNQASNEMDTEFILDVKHMFPVFPPEYHPDLIHNIMYKAVDRKQNADPMFSWTLCKLLSNNAVSPENFCLGLAKILKDPELSLKVPSLNIYLTNLVIEPIRLQLITLQQILSAAITVDISLSQKIQFFAALLEELRDDMSSSLEKKRWEELILRLNQWMDAEKENKIQPNEHCGKK